MIEYNELEQKLVLKLVYYGPALSGKTTNLMQLHEALDTKGRSDLMVLDTKDDRTIFFDLLPFYFVTPTGLKIKVKAEMSLNDILSAPEAASLLTAVNKGGAELAAITDHKGRFLWAEGDRNGARELPPSIKQDAAKGKYEDLNWRLWRLYNEAEPIVFFLS